jgi:hypothetical protein
MAIPTKRPATNAGRLKILLRRRSRSWHRARSRPIGTPDAGCAMLLLRLGVFRTEMDMDRAPIEGLKVWNCLAKTPRIFVIAMALTFSALPAYAHHSGAMFDMVHQITLTGVVTKVEWTDPHTFMYVNVKNDKGVVEEWAIEINSPNFLRHNGWTSSTVSAGDTITCTGAPAKSGSRFMHGMTVELSNGVQLRS